MLTLPALADSPERHADWLELQALMAPEGYISWSDHQRDLAIGSTADSLGKDELDGSLERCIDETAAEMADRMRSCGGSLNGYPFEVSQDGVTCQKTTGTLYRFLLLLSQLGKDAAGQVPTGDKLFEELCVDALGMYLGQSPAVRGMHFGFPRDWAQGLPRRRRPTV